MAELFRQSAEMAGGTRPCRVRTQIARFHMVQPRRSRWKRIMAAVLPAIALLTLADVFDASAQSVFEQVFGDRMPGYGTYTPKTRSYRRGEPEQKPRVANVDSGQRRIRELRSAALSVGRIESEGRKRKADRPAVSVRPGAGVSGPSVRVHTPDRSERNTLSPVRTPAYSTDRFANRGGSYRTVCVRECDGYFFPVSFAVPMRNFKDDAAVCASQCGSPVSLYYYPNPGGDIEDMVSYETGKPYKEMKNAFRFQKEFDAACRCQPEPWTEEARKRHQFYALANLDSYEEVKKEQVAAKSANRGNRKRRAHRATPRRSAAIASVRVVTPGARRDLRPTRTSSVRYWSF